MVKKNAELPYHKCKLGGTHKRRLHANLDTIYAIIFMRDGQPMTTTLSVAFFYGKRHDNILRMIKNFDLPLNWYLLNFEEVSYPDSGGRQQPMYYLTEEGYVFLVAKLTGPEADEFLAQFIDVFHMMKETLQQGAIVPADTSMVLSEQALEKELSWMGVKLATGASDIDPLDGDRDTNTLDIRILSSPFRVSNLATVARLPKAERELWVDLAGAAHIQADVFQRSGGSASTKFSICRHF